MIKDKITEFSNNTTNNDDGNVDPLVVYFLQCENKVVYIMLK